MTKILVLATNNKNKVREFKEILKNFDIEIRTLSDFGPIPEAIEDGDTFDDNAYKKAHHTAKILGLPAIADDSGLEVEALGGAPGVYSARFAGKDATDEQNCDKLLEEMEGKENRRAAFCCVISIVVPSGPALTYEGRCSGLITDKRHGNNGFGYDPVFFHEKFGKTFAEISAQEKHSISHRGQALSEIKNEADKIIKWLNQRLYEEKTEKPDHNEFMDNDWSE